jgi:hypothetical protein
MFLGDPGKEAGNIDKGDDGQVEAVTKPDEPRGLERSVDIEDARQYGGLVGDDAYRPATEAGKADDDVLRVGPVHFQEPSIIHHPPDDSVHVVRLVGVVGDDVEQRGISTVGRVVGGPARWTLEVIER